MSNVRDEGIFSNPWIPADMNMPSDAMRPRQITGAAPGYAGGQVVSAPSGFGAPMPPWSPPFNRGRECIVCTNETFNLKHDPAHHPVWRRFRVWACNNLPRAHRACGNDKVVGCIPPRQCGYDVIATKAQWDAFRSRSR